MRRFLQFFRYPAFENEDKNRISRFLNTFILSCIAVCVPILIITFAYGWSRSMTITCIALLLLSFAYFIFKLKYLVTAIFLTFSTVMGGTLYSIYYGDGIHDITLLLIPVSFILASFLLTLRPYVLFSMGSTLALGLTVVLRQHFYLPDFHGSDYISEYMIIACFLVISAVIVRWLTEDLFRAVRVSSEQSRRLQNIFNNVLDVYYEIDVDGTFLELSPSVEQLTGYQPGELLDTSMVRLCQQESSHQILIEKVLDEGRVNNFELALVHQKGQTVDVSINASLINGKESFQKIVGSMRDITEQRFLEAQLIQSQKMESVGTLAGGIAHDFNNLLTAIGGHVEFAESKANHNPDILEDLEVIRGAVNRAEHLTQQILAFSRKQVHQPEILQINELIQNSEKMFRRLIGEDIKIDMIFENDLPPIKADPSQIEQILLNLLVNARDAIYSHPDPDHEKRITVKTGLQHLDENYVSTHIDSQVGDHIYLAVADTGIGMDAQIQSKIFDPFFTTKEKGKGTGLGLSTVIGIVKQNHGSLFVYSEPNQGSLFRIYWPPSQEQLTSVSKEKRKTASKHLAGSERILFVEDSEDVRLVGCDALEDFGYSVIAAESGENALELIAQLEKPIDLLITDLVMPGINGKELYSQTIEIIPDVRVLFMSGYADDRILKDGIIDTDLNFLHKPFSMIGLVEKVRDILDNK